MNPSNVPAETWNNNRTDQGPLMQSDLPALILMQNLKVANGGEDFICWWENHAISLKFPMNHSQKQILSRDRVVKEDGTPLPVGPERY